MSIAISPAYCGFTGAVVHIRSQFVQNGNRFLVTGKLWLLNIPSDLGGPEIFITILKRFSVLIIGSISARFGHQKRVAIRRRSSGQWRNDADISIFVT